VFCWNVSAQMHVTRPLVQMFSFLYISVSLGFPTPDLAIFEMAKINRGPHIVQLLPLFY